MSEKEKEIKSEKEKEMEEEEEEEIIHHWSHHHPLALVETCRGDQCYGCQQQFSSGEKAYGCSIKECEYKRLLHEECAETARKIRHQKHPQHTLIQQHEINLLMGCAICERYIWSIGYKCTSTGCGFQMHMRCANVGSRMMYATADDDTRNHPSHPEHDLRLFEKHGSFMCDACGTTRRGKFYLCTSCQYLIHQRCASLPQTFKREDHHHPLSLSFHFPLEYIQFGFKCDVCNKYLLPNYWIYHCQLCRYYVHIKCVFKKPPNTTINNANSSIIHLPTNEVAEELITPFLMRQAIPHDDGEMVINVKYKFDHHKHELTLISSSSSSSSSSQHDQNQEEEEEENEEDYGKRSEKLICDGCFTPILSSSSSYMSCSSKYCKYYLHMACFHLPPQLPSLPFHHEDDHQLHLQSVVKPWESIWCSVCSFPSNGLFYACTKCDFKADIKCASVPETIYHAAHPQHPLKHVRKEDMARDNYLRQLRCAAVCYYYEGFDCYTCYDCDFMVHTRCVVLPASVTSRRWDRQHPLPLTYNANLNHPGDFYCDECETQMNPKSWMYHCRRCDLSFHPKCFPVTSGWYRNMKFGHSVNALAHPHPLTHQLLTTKRRCDLCHYDRHGCEGFHCASCNFFICLFHCGYEMLGNGSIEVCD